VQTSSLRYSTTITIARNNSETDLTISAIATLEAGRVYLSELVTSPLSLAELTASERGKAEDKITDCALCHPETGISP
jgi:cytochrome c553